MEQSDSSEMHRSFVAGSLDRNVSSAVHGGWYGAVQWNPSMMTLAWTWVVLGAVKVFIKIHCKFACFALGHEWISCSSSS